MSMDELGQVVPCSANMQHGECDVCSAELQQASITMQHRCQIHSICWACVEDNCLRHLAATRTPKCPFCTQQLSGMEKQFLETRLKDWKAAQAAEGASEGQAKTRRPEKRRAQPKKPSTPRPSNARPSKKAQQGKAKGVQKASQAPKKAAPVQTCPHCGYKTDRTSNMKRHWRDFHQLEETGVEPARPHRPEPTDVANYIATCKGCIQGFKEKKELDNHLKRSTHCEYYLPVGAPEAAAPTTSDSGDAVAQAPSAE